MESIQKPNYSKWRAFTLSAVYLLIGLHIAHWKITGRTLAPLEFNEVLYTIHLGIITAGFLFMALAILSTALVGRFFCSWLCHMIALQDASAWFLQKLNIRPKHFRSRILLWIPFLAVLYLFILPQIERIYLGQPAITFKVLSDKEGWASFATTNFWRNLPGIGITLFTFFICGFFIVYFLGTRSFCQYACPYGAVFSMTDRIAPGKIILQGNCNQCGICTSVCQSHILIHKEVLQFGKVVDSNCLKDLDCVQVCPNDALKFGFTKPSFFQSLRTGNKNKKQYDFTYPEDVLLGMLFLLFIFIYRGLYDSIPFLLALAVSLLLAYWVIVFIRLFHSDFVRTASVVLKQSGKVTGSGKVFKALFLALILFTIHNGWIHYHQYKGNALYNQVAWYQENHSVASDQSILIADARKHLELVDKFGIYHPATLSRELAAIYLLDDEKQKASIQLEHILNELPHDLEARFHYAKLLFVSGNQAKSIEQLKQVIDEQTLSTHDHNVSSECFLMLGHIDEKNGFASEALGKFHQALKINPGNDEAVLALGVLYARTNQLAAAESYLKHASQLYPKTALVENNLATVYIRMHKYALAQSHLENLLMIQPGNLQAQYNLAMMKYAQGKREESETLLKEIIKKDPGFSQAHDAFHMITKSS